jgi:hypothetical protein
MLHDLQQLAVLACDQVLVAGIFETMLGDLASHVQEFNEHRGGVAEWLASLTCDWRLAQNL